MQTAVILAGGKGTRLSKIRMDIPKPMMPVLDKPILQYQIELLVEHGFKKVWLVVGHLHEQIQEYFQDGAQFGISIKYYVEDTPLGTVGGLKAIENELVEPFLVLYGDVMINMDLKKLIRFHQSKHADATLVVHPNDHPYDSDLLDINEREQVVAFYPKPHPNGLRYRNLVNAAAYIFDPVVLSKLEGRDKSRFRKRYIPLVIQVAH
jgi:mannose-1-phosphate guanylyltransferase/phosphomannomutase